MSLLEITAVVTILAVVAATSISRYGFNSLSNGGADGFARKIALSLAHARRSTIATGDNHYLQLASSGGSVISFALMRRDVSGDAQVDQTYTVPADVTVTSTHSVLEFDFEGSALNSYTVTIAGLDRTWTVSVVMLTGAIQVAESL